MEDTMSDTALTPEVVEQETQALDIYQQAYAVKVVDKAT